MHIHAHIHMFFALLSVTNCRLHYVAQYFHVRYFFRGFFCAAFLAGETSFFREKGGSCPDHMICMLRYIF